jgi:hypothetical protein
MKIKNVQGIIILVIFLLFANHALASDWILYGSPDTGKEYYDKGSIQKVNKHIVRVWTKKILKASIKHRIILINCIIIWSYRKLTV